MTDIISRRSVLKTLALGAGTAAGLNALEVNAASATKPATKASPKLAPAATPAGPPRLDPNDAAAKALGYVPDAAKVDAKSNPMYVKGSLCSNCLQLQGKAGDPYRPCNLFPGKLVAANGWCKVYAKKG